jgi:PIN domain nuclease of toxin-antitoxin system
VSGWLIDAHALIWFLADDQRLSQEARAIMQAADSELFVSASTVWEIAIKVAQGKLRFPDDLEAALEEERFHTLDVRLEHAWHLRELSAGPHKDPFDRLLVAQAQVEKLAIISNDAQLDQYEVERIW